MDGWIGDGTRGGITGAFGVPGGNDNGRRVLLEFRQEREMCRHLQRISWHPQGWRGARDRVELKSTIDRVLLKRVRGMGRGPLELRLVGTWLKRREVVVGCRRKIRSEKLRHHQYSEGYERS